MRPSLLALIALAIATSGCATLFNGTRQSIAFRSSPAGATVLVDGQAVCEKTPCDAKLSRGSEHAVQLKLPGHYPYRMIVRQEGSSWVLGNIITTGPVGIVVDLVSGGAWILEPEEIDRRLEPLAPLASIGGVP